MKLVDSEFTFDNNKVLFYFKQMDVLTLGLSYDLHLFLKESSCQIGVRDETKVIGGIGICGRNLCCNSYLQNFHLFQ